MPCAPAFLFVTNIRRGWGFIAQTYLAMKTILVVGGSSGIGAAMLEQHHKEHRCINISRREPASHLDVEHHTVDVLSDDLPEIETLDGLVYCPGSINLKPVSSFSHEDLEQDFRINTSGAFRVLKHYLPALKKSQQASVVLFSTVAVGKGMPFHISVATVKAGVEAMTRTLAAELSPGIRVNCIAPSLTETPLAERLLRSEKQRENAAERHPLKRIGQAEDLAHSVRFLLSDESSWITGQVLHVDGGLSVVQS